MMDKLLRALGVAKGDPARIAILMMAGMALLPFPVIAISRLRGDTSNDTWLIASAVFGGVTVLLIVTTAIHRREKAASHAAEEWIVWPYTSEEAASFARDEWASAQATTQKGLGVIAGLSLFVGLLGALGGAMISREHGLGYFFLGTVSVGAVSLGALGLHHLYAWFTFRRPATAGELWIGERSVIYGGQTLSLRDSMSKLVGVTVEHGNPSVLVFTVRARYFVNKHNRSEVARATTDHRVPVPRGREREARALAARMTKELDKGNAETRRMGTYRRPDDRATAQQAMNRPGATTETIAESAAPSPAVAAPSLPRPRSIREQRRKRRKQRASVQRLQANGRRLASDD